MKNHTPQNPENINLSVVILCYRSGESIIEFAKKAQERIEALTSSYEIILVGNYFDNSNDNTKEVVEKIASEDSRFIPVCYPKEGMMGWDMRSGLENASGKYICVIDGDGQFPVESLDICYNEIIKGKYDLVKTYRISRGDGIYRKTISKVYNFLFTLLFPGLNAKDINSKPKIFTKQAYKQFKLTSDDWFIDAEIMITARRLKLKVKDFPVDFLKLENRQSFVKFGAILEFVKNLLIFRIKEFRGVK
jgi:glycosyltransferase involved in cell wall biosynthesis